MALTQVSPALLNDEAQAQGFRNRIINGDMRIDQRNAGAAVTTNGAYFVDRFTVLYTSAGTYSAQQSSSIVPTGFVNSAGFTVTSADGTLDAGDFACIQHWIEGNNVADLGFGTANAKTITISFWARASITGTYCVVLLNSSSNGTSSPNRSYVAEYSISSANTWEYKTVTIPGDTGGTWHTGTGRGFAIRFGLSAGTNYQQGAGSWSTGNVIGSSNQTNMMATNGATFYITGVQLEVGSVATEFERRPYGTELQLCQRYCVLYAQGTEMIGSGAAWTSDNFWCVVRMPTTMRSSPTLSATTGTNYYVWQSNATNTYCNSVTDPVYVGGANLGNLLYQAGLSPTLSGGNGVVLRGNDAGTKVLYTAEL